MPVCKNCSKYFPDRAYINGKEFLLKSRSYCLECSPQGSKNGYELRKKQAKQTAPLPDTKICPICSKKSPYTKNNVCSTCRSWYTRWQNKLRGIELLGGKCLGCDENDPEVLSFHHKNPETKEFQISWNQQKAWEKLKIEIEKCELLCMNCHIKHHKKDNAEKIKKIQEYFSSCPKKKNQYG